jgi:predicted transcriptional regulator
MSLFPMPTLDRECEHCAGTGKQIDHRLLGESLRLFRSSAKVTATEVAAALGLSKSYICDLELGRREWRRDLIIRYRQAVVGARDASR